jgi:hypothetical protein
VKFVFCLALTFVNISKYVYSGIVKNGLGFGVGGNESSLDEEEEDSTLKCSGTAWSGSDSVPHHRSSSTSDFSSSSSSSEEAEDLDHPSHKPCRPSEGVPPLNQGFFHKLQLLDREGSRSRVTVRA